MKHIYLISANIEGNTVYKIGISKNVKKRFRQLKTGNPYIEEIVYSVLLNKHYSKVESALHNLFKSNKISGEWFMLSDNEVNNFHKTCNMIYENFVILENSTLSDKLF